MASERRNASAENATTIAVEKESMSGCFTAEPARVLAALIGDNGYAGDLRGGFPQLSITPLRAYCSGIDEHDVGAKLARRASHDLCKLIHTCPGAGAVGMGKHHQGIAVLGENDTGFGRP